MSTKLHWVDGPWPGKLALAARPRGGDWLEDLDLVHEGRLANGSGMKFISFSIPDRQVPNSQTEMAALVERIDRELSAGRNVVVHCRQGIGRTGLVGACLFTSKGSSPAEAIQSMSAARGNPIPETDEQRRWIEHYAAILAGPK